MKKVLFVAMLSFLFTLTVSTAFAGGGKVRGCVGEGDVNQYQIDAATHIVFECVE